jgi:xanthine dehydrogenase accessory factor
MIGSRRKARLIFGQFLEDRLASPEQIAAVACPVGLPIESRTVPEIAVSILAQFVQERARTLRRLAEGPAASLLSRRRPECAPGRPASAPVS